MIWNLCEREKDTSRRNRGLVIGGINVTRIHEHPLGKSGRSKANQAIQLNTLTSGFDLFSRTLRQVTLREHGLNIKPNLAWLVSFHLTWIAFLSTLCDTDHYDGYYIG